MKINKDLSLSIKDYTETECAEQTNRVLNDGSTDSEWEGYGTIAGLKAKATYYTTDADAENAYEDENWDRIDWLACLKKVEIITDDGVTVVTIFNKD
jgi:hypothetical protein